LTGLLPEKSTPMRKTLAWIGGLTLIPTAALIVAVAPFFHWQDLPLP